MATPRVLGVVKQALTEQAIAALETPSGRAPSWLTPDSHAQFRRGHGPVSALALLGNAQNGRETDA